MIIVPRKSVWTRQPQGPVAPRIPSLMYHPPVSPGPNIVTRRGIGGDFITGADRRKYVSGSINGVTTCTIFVAAEVRSTGVDHRGMIGSRSDTSDAAFIQIVQRSDGVFGAQVKINNASNETYSNAGKVTLGQHTLILSIGADCRFYVDGVLIAVFARSTQAALSSHPSVVVGAYYNNTSYRRFDGVVYNGGVALNKVFTASDARRYHDNYASMFEPRTRRTIITLGAPLSSTDLNASATGAAQSGGSAALAAQVALAGIGVALAGGSASAAVAVPLSASGIAVAGGGANGTATVRISASGLAQAAGAAGLSASILLAAAGAAQAAGNATLAAQLAALASGAAQAGGSASLSGGAHGALAASGGGQTSGQAVISVTVQLAATGAAQSGGAATGSASAPGQIAASGSAQAGGAGTVSVTVQLTAAGFVQAMGAGQFSVQIPLQAVGQALSSGSAALALFNGSTLDPGPERYRVRAAPRVTRVIGRRTTVVTAERRNYVVTK